MHGAEASAQHKRSMGLAAVDTQARGLAGQTQSLIPSTEKAMVAGVECSVRGGRAAQKSRPQQQGHDEHDTPWAWWPLLLY